VGTFVGIRIHRIEKLFLDQPLVFRYGSLSRQLPFSVSFARKLSLHPKASLRLVVSDIAYDTLRDPLSVMAVVTIFRTAFMNRIARSLFTVPGTGAARS